MENLKIYSKMAEPPAKALKPITAGRLKGKSDINPQWRYQVMTENFGICGIGWKFTIDKTWLEQGADGEVVANAQVSVYVRDPDTKEWSDAIVGVGGSMFVTNERNGKYTSDEAYKMAVTDAFSTSLKMLGVAAAVYEGRWDGSKYSKADYEVQKEIPPMTPELQKAIDEVEKLIDSGVIKGDGLTRVKDYILEHNLEKLNGTINYFAKQAVKAKEEAGASEAFDR